MVDFIGYFSDCLVVIHARNLACLFMSPHIELDFYHKPKNISVFKFIRTSVLFL